MKYCISLMAAVLVSLALFFLMHELTATAHHTPDVRDLAVIDFSLHEVDSKPSRIERNKKKLQPPPEIKPLPELPARVTSEQAPLTEMPFEVTKVGVTNVIDTSRLKVSPVLGQTGENQAKVSVVIEPIYPPQARRDGIEGDVTLAFNINAQGRAFNIEVIESNPRGYFERSAIAALRRWRFSEASLDSKKTVTLAFDLQNEM